MLLRKRISDIADSCCGLCDLHKTRRRIVVSRGNPAADVVIIGRDPGEDEDIIGLPFVGKAGILLDEIIRDAGYVPDEDFFFTNVCLCHTPDNTGPTAEQMMACRGNLVNLTKSFDRFFVVGKTSLEGVAGAYHYRINTGKPVKDLLTHGAPIRFGDRKIFVSYHPSYLLRQGITKMSKKHSLYNLLKNELIDSKEC